MFFNKGLTLLFFLFIALFATAQTTTPLTGTIQDEQSQGIPGASIQVANTNIRTMSDDKGRFKINIPKGKVQLIITSVGFEKTVRSMNNTLMRLK
jgi:hypothetical protein